MGSFHHPDGDRAGWYTNLIEPPELEGRRWRIRDRWLDVWQPADGEPRLLDEDELEAAADEGLVDADEARQ
ncbi:MAG: DUF402 domain-containing protein, partial [Gemmatimonadota bacterium]